MSHPTKEILESYANGSLSDGMSLLVASHLTYCPECRREVAFYEAIGGALFADEPVAETGPSLDAALAAINTPVDTAALEDQGPLPRPILNEIGVGFGDINWRFLLPGLHEAVLDGFGDEQVSLLRAKPGTGIMHHTHKGDEATLILSGALEDNGEVFETGDVALADHNHTHRPRVVGDEICYCLIVVSGSLHFTGPMGRALNLFTR